VAVGILNELSAAVVADTLTVNVNTGSAIVNGHFIISDAVSPITVSAGNPQPRIVVIAIESNENTGVRAGRLIVVQGTPAANPSAPALTTSGGIYQTALYQLLVPANAANLNSATLTDVRAFCNGRHLHGISGVSGLQTALESKAALSHTHAISNVTSLQDSLNAKLASAAYTASDVLAKVKTVDGDGSGLDADTLDGAHAGSFATAGHSHDDRYYTESEMNNALAGKSGTSHTHDDRYFTEGETNGLLSGKSSIDHLHDERYYTESEVNALVNARIAGVVSGSTIRYAATQPSMNVGDIWLKPIA
jgi:hypothetical protein